MRHRRIIPARAGQTPACSHCRRTSPDHPRACGANSSRLNASSMVNGSSPRVRGKLGPDRLRWPTVRIIPARAGQTNRPSAHLSRTPDHPRACGANRASRTCSRNASGSSPRVRGKQPEGYGDRAHVRIIPARAGQTLQAGGHPVGQSDHPRACGANMLLMCIMRLRFGSSPRVRGKLGGLRVGVVQGRIIPARAGQT